MTKIHVKFNPKGRLNIYDDFTYEKRMEIRHEEDNRITSLQTRWQLAS